MSGWSQPLVVPARGVETLPGTGVEVHNPSDQAMVLTYSTRPSMPAVGDVMAWRMRFHTAFARRPLCRWGGLFKLWRAPDAPEADRMAAAATDVVLNALGIEVTR